MELKKRIYCVEGVHDWGDDEVEPTVEPMLELLQRVGYWESYLHRTCGTMAELEYRLKTEWNNYCTKGSVLYFFTHGGPGQVCLSDDEVVNLLQLTEWIDCEGCHIHFGGCDTFSWREDDLSYLMERTGATSISGYAAEVGWLGGSAPALALEVRFFGLLSEVNIARNAINRPKELRCKRSDITTRFPDCKFNMLVREHRKR